MSNVTYPLAMPTTGIASSDFQLKQVDSINVLRSGAAHGTSLAPDYWDISLATAPVTSSSARYRLWRAFLMALRGSKKVGLFYDPDKPLPVSYRNFGGLVRAVGGAAFDGTAAVQSITDRYTIVVESLPAQFKLLATDYIGFIQGGRYSLHSLVLDTTASNGGIATVDMVPALPSLFDTDATVNFLRPCCEGILTADSMTTGRELEATPISFKARSKAM